MFFGCFIQQKPQKITNNIKTSKNKENQENKQKTIEPTHIFYRELKIDKPFQWLQWIFWNKWGRKHIL